MADESDLLVVGAGAKAAGLAAKVHAFNSLGLGPISMTVVEGTEVAASWKGRNGMTSGEEPLAVTPIKDVGFPYQSFREFGEAGEAIDDQAMRFSWQRYMVARRRYARWIDAGSPSVRHRDYGEYLTWVLSRATEGVGHVAGRVTRVSLEEGERWAVEVDEGEGIRTRHLARSLVLTGPGIHREFPHEPGIAGRVFHCDSRREEFAQLPEDEGCDVAIVGGGESALSCVMFLRGFRPRSRFTIYTPMLPMSRGESFLENRVFSNPDEVEWTALDQTTRRDFVKHSDRGVFDPPSLAAIAYDDRCRFVTGRITDVAAARGGAGVRLQHHSPEGLADPEHDYVVNCTGFDLLAQLRTLFPAETRAEIEGRVGSSGTPRRGPRCRSAATSSCWRCSRVCRSPAWPGSARARGSPTSARSGLLANRVLQPLFEERLPEPATDHVSANT